MATILKSYNWDKISRNTEGRSQTYPWEQWFDGQIWKLKPEKDFTVPAFALERVIRTAANRKSKFIRVRITDDGYVILQARDTKDENGDAPAKPAAKTSKASKTTTTNGDASKTSGNPTKVKSTTKVTQAAPKAAKVAKATPKAMASSDKTPSANGAPAAKRTVKRSAPAPAVEPKPKRVIRRTAAA